MSSLDNQKILFCVSGGPAAYQAPELIAALSDEGARVTLLASPEAGDWVSLGLLRKLAASGVTDLADLHLGVTSFNARVVLLDDEFNAVASAWLIGLRELITSDAGVTTVFLGGSSALERAGLTGEPDSVVLPGATSAQLSRFDPTAMTAAIARQIGASELLGRRVLVTAGPTYEDIDPVRFIGNRSSGKMGFAVAAAAWQAGAQVTLITGPVARPSPQGVAVVPVRSALDMLAAVDTVIADQDIYISSAAVADYRPAQSATQKIKKGKADSSLSLIANPDLLARVASRPSPPFCVGFAAETEQVEAYARDKMVSKNLQMIAANCVGAKEGGFESDQNRLHLFWPGGDQLLDWSSKADQARQLIAMVARLYLQWNNSKQAEERACKPFS